MNFLRSAILMALLSLVTVFAGPPPSYFTNDGVFEYMIQGDYAYSIGIKNKDVKKLVVKPYATYKGKQYPVIVFDTRLEGTKVESFVIPSQVTQDFSIGYNVFSNVKTLKTIQIDAMHVSAQYDTFDNMNKKVEFKGKGIDYMMAAYAESILVDKYMSSFEYNASH